MFTPSRDAIRWDIPEICGKQVNSISPEPWLRGPLPDVHPAVMPVLFSFQQVREDLRKHTRGISDLQVWSPTAAGTLGFQLKHLAGSVDRISTYLVGEGLTEQQLQQLSTESDGKGTLAELLIQVEQSVRAGEERAREVDPAQLFAFRGVGRKNLPSTVIGLLVHLAEHTQRHLGQAITLTQVIRGSRIPPPEAETAHEQ